MARVLIELVGGPKDGWVYVLEAFKPRVEFPTEQHREIVEWETDYGPIMADYAHLSTIRYEPTGKYTKAGWLEYKYVEKEIE